MFFEDAPRSAHGDVLVPATLSKRGPRTPTIARRITCHFVPLNISITVSVGWGPNVVLSSVAIRSLRSRRKSSGDAKNANRICTDLSTFVGGRRVSGGLLLAARLSPLSAAVWTVLQVRFDQSFQARPQSCPIDQSIDGRSVGGARIA
jgi:hypothetical protein